MWKKKKTQTRWFYIAQYAKSFIHTANICAGRKVPS